MEFKMYRLVKEEFTMTKICRIADIFYMPTCVWKHVDI